MRRPFGVAVIVFLSVVAANAETRGAVDWIFLVDTSQSMRGVGGSRDIFGDVKTSLETFVREAHDGDSVSVYTFDRDVQLRGSTDIRAPYDREELFAIIRDLHAEGARTHLGLAIAKGLDRSEALLQRNDPTRQRAIVLFTDGKEDVRGIREPVPIAANVKRVPISKPWIFFVSMGEHEAQLDMFANDPALANRTKIVKPHDAQSIEAAARDIRQIVRPPDPPPRPRVKVAHTALPPPPPPSLLVRVARWAGAIAVLLLLALIAIVLRSGKTPGELLASLRNTLEGEIEILQPRTAPDAAFVGLPRLGLREVALSSIVPLDALGGSDARLFCRRTGDEITMWIAAGSGTLRVNDIEVPLSELYDADTIRIGEAKLRFNRVGHERPGVTLEGEDQP
jgi:hypothetical protein